MQLGSARLGSMVPAGPCRAMLRSSPPHHCSHSALSRWRVDSAQLLWQARPHPPQSMALQCRRSRGKVQARASDPNPFLRSIEKQADIQTNKIPEAIRERVEQAVERLGGRVTVGDVAARAGVKLKEAEDALQALAYDTLGTLEVSPEGEVVYVLDRNFRDVLRNKSVLLQVRPVLRTLQRAGMWLVRFSFGAALVASVLLVMTALLALNSNRDERRSSNGGEGGAIFRGPWLGDLWIWWDPYPYRRQRREGEMGFFESIFSVVFGDGDPNMDYEEQRWRQLGQFIQSKGGVVTAEQLAPFLDPPLRRESELRKPYEDEGFVLPALVRLGGEPLVDQQGNLLYRFPALQATAQEPELPPFQSSLRWFRPKVAPPPAPSPSLVPLEQPWRFSGADGVQKALVTLLGGANLVGVAWLTSALADPRAVAILLREGLGFVLELMPALQLYAAAFVAIPLFRLILNEVRNRDIDQRNDARLQAAATAASSAPAVLSKVEAARQLAARKVVRQQDAIFTTAVDTEPAASAMEMDDWDTRLRGR